MVGAVCLAACVARGFGFAIGLIVNGLFAVSFSDGFGLTANLRRFVKSEPVSAMPLDRGRFVEGGVGNDVTCVGLAGVIVGRVFGRAGAEGSEEAPLLQT